jgi:hypothetical protein
MSTFNLQYKKVLDVSRSLFLSPALFFSINELNSIIAKNPYLYPSIMAFQRLSSLLESLLLVKTCVSIGGSCDHDQSVERVPALEMDGQ